MSACTHEIRTGTRVNDDDDGVKLGQAGSRTLAFPPFVWLPRLVESGPKRSGAPAGPAGWLVRARKRDIRPAQQRKERMNGRHGARERVEAPPPKSRETHARNGTGEQQEMKEERERERERNRKHTEIDTAAVAHDHEILMALNRRGEVRREVARGRPMTSERPSERASVRACERERVRGERERDDGARRRADRNCARNLRFGVRFKKDSLGIAHAMSHVTVGQRTTCHVRGGKRKKKLNTSFHNAPISVAVEINAKHLFARFSTPDVIEIG